MSLSAGNGFCGSNMLIKAIFHLPCMLNSEVMLAFTPANPNSNVRCGASPCNSAVAPLEDSCLLCVSEALGCFSFSPSMCVCRVSGRAFLFNHWACFFIQLETAPTVTRCISRTSGEPSGSLRASWQTISPSGGGGGTTCKNHCHWNLKSCGIWSSIDPR